MTQRIISVLLTYHTIFRNVPVKYLSKLNNKQFKERTKKLMDSKYKEDASNFTGETEVAILHGSDYYETYEDAFGDVATMITVYLMIMVSCGIQDMVLNMTLIQKLRQNINQNSIIIT